LSTGSFAVSINAAPRVSFSRLFFFCILKRLFEALVCASFCSRLHPMLSETSEPSWAKKLAAAASFLSATVGTLWCLQRMQRELRLSALTI
jgi:hypothetical protein